jgi:DNA-binding transcriptional regulator YiaG
MTEIKKARKMISARKGVKTKTEVAREIMSNMSGMPFKDIVMTVRDQTKLSRELSARYVKVNASRVAGFTVKDGKMK